MTKNERQLKEISEIIERLSAKQCTELIKAIKIINAVSHEQGVQIISLRESGLSIEEIAKKWGVAL